MTANQISIFRDRLTYKYLGLVLLLILCSLCSLIFSGNPLRSCIDLLSGNVPLQAQELFIQRIIEKTIEEDYDWLVSVGHEKVARDLIDLKPKMTASYTIVASDNFGGTYEYSIRFENGTKLYLDLLGQWPSCLDFKVTEEKVLQNIQLIYVSESNVLKGYQDE